MNVAVFKNRVEVRSPGLLYGGLTIEKIKTEMVSERRNEMIAEIFHRAHFIEKWGRGIGLILSKEPETDFKEVGRHFIVTFKRKAVSTSEGLVERLVEGLVESQRKIIELFKENPSISKKELAEKIGISTTAIDKNINTLKKKKLIRRIGPDKGGHWELIDQWHC